jgi:hypothetical protein
MYGAVVAICGDAGSIKEFSMKRVSGGFYVAIAAVALSGGVMLFGSPAEAVSYVSLGKKIKVSNPASGNRSTLVMAKESATDIATSGAAGLDGIDQPDLNGATLTVIVAGNSATSQTFSAPAGALWSPLGTVGWKYNDPSAATGVKLILIKKTAGDVFLMKALLKGVAGVLDLVPPDTAVDQRSRMVLTFGGGGNTYCASWNGTANGTVNKDDSSGYLVVNPDTEVGCPTLCSGSTTLSFTTGLPGGTCGHLNAADDDSGANLAPIGQAAGTDLQCSSLYIGGGASIQPPSPTPDNAQTIFKTCGIPAALVLAAATSTDTGNNRNCSAPGCFFGPPLPIPNPAAPVISTCVINTISGDPDAGGTLNALTGASTQTLPLLSKVYVTGGVLGLLPCPQCIALACSAGPNATQPCTTTNAQLTTHDCPPPGTPLAPFVVDLTPLGTGTISASDSTGDFCGAGTGAITPNYGQTTNGAFGCPGGVADGTKVARCGGAITEYIEQNGSAGGNLTAGPALATTLASVFCIPSSGDITVDTIANLPGPGAVTLKGTADLLP